jgi:carbonic anhydrase/acetyltransferase-like protein (isoleucine patch superfamily)
LIFSTHFFLHLLSYRYFYAILLKAFTKFYLRYFMSTANLRTYNGISPILGHANYIDSSSVLVGDITLGADVSIWPLVAARGDVNLITIGARTNVQDGSVLHVTRKSEHNPNGNPLIIGEDVTIGHKCMLHGCTLGDRILVGMGAIIMDGAVVQDDVFIGAGSLVPPNKTLLSGYLYMGNPIKQARKLKESEADFLKKSAENYVELKNDYLNQKN